MRNFMKKVAAMIRAMRASVSEVVLRTVRGVDGTLSWVWDVVTRSSVTAPVDFEPAGYDVPEPAAPATDAETLDAGLRLVGEQVVRAAAEMLRHGEIRSGDIALDVAGWVRSLSRDDLRILAEADTLAAGRHVAGMEPMLDIVGHAIRRPDPAGDADRLAKRRRLQEERQADERAQVAAARQRMEQERERQWAIQPDVPALVPSF